MIVAGDFSFGVALLFELSLGFWRAVISMVLGALGRVQQQGP